MGTVHARQDRRGCLWLTPDALTPIIYWHSDTGQHALISTCYLTGQVGRFLCLRMVQVSHAAGEAGEGLAHADGLIVTGLDEWLGVCVGFGAGEICLLLYCVLSISLVFSLYILTGRLAFDTQQNCLVQ